MIFLFNFPVMLKAYQSILQDMDMERAALQQQLSEVQRENDMVRWLRHPISLFGRINKPIKKHPIKS